MSMWDFVAAASIATNINDPNSKAAKILKKINSASLNVLNGDKVDYVGAGGRTTNTFGAVTTINCDMQAVLQGYFNCNPLWGALFGPGAVNLMTIGNKTELQYMPAGSDNLIIRRGGRNIKIATDTMAGPGATITLLVWFFVLAIFGFYLIYNFAGAFGEIMSPVGENRYVEGQQGKVDTKDQEIAALEASDAQQNKEQQQRTDAGYVLSPAEQDSKNKELQDTEDQLAAAESQKAELESTLKTAERQKAWLLYGNVILESSGFWVIKEFEKAKAASYSAMTQVITSSNERERQEIFYQALVDRQRNTAGTEIMTDWENEFMDLQNCPGLYSYAQKLARAQMNGMQEFFNRRNLLEVNTHGESLT